MAENLVGAGGAVLIVEDDPVTAELERRSLTRSGRQAHVAGRVDEALEALRSTRFDALLVDYQLPDGDAWPIFEAARRCIPPVPVIFATGGGDERIAAEVIRRGGADYLIKSEGFWDQLPTVVDRVIRTARTEQANLRLAALVESSEDAIINRSLEGRILTWNGGAERIFGYTAEEAIGQPIDMLTPPGREGEQVAIMDRLHRGLPTRQFETVRRRKDGSLVDISMTVSPIFDAAHQVSSGADVKRDISERKRTERVLAIRNELIRISAESMSLQEAAPDFLRVLGEGLGYAEGALWLLEGHQTMRCVQRWRQDGQPAQGPDTLPRGEFPAAAWGEHAVAEGEDGLLIPVASRGNIRGVIELRGLPTAQLEAGISEWLSVVGLQVGQFAEKCRTDDLLRQAQKMEAIGQLAGGIAHDFNNLLSVIHGYTEVLLERLEPGAYGIRQITEIQRAGERATELTRQLLAFSRQRESETRVVEVNSVIKDMQKMLERLIGEDIRLITLLSPEPGRVQVGATQIEQVIMNLVVNARDAMTAGGTLTVETLNVSLDASFVQSHVNLRPGPYVLLAVSDTGVGMSSATQARIFEPFFTTKEIGHGTGLGLATVFGIVEQGGGHIYVYSELGRGTTFKIFLPRVQSAVSPELLAPRNVTRQRGTETLLVVEDEEQLRTLICSVLQEAGYTVIEAAGPNQALEVLADPSRHIHLLLTDVVMPEKRGPVLAAEAAQLRPDIKVLFISGYTGGTISRNTNLDPGAHFLPKPFTTAKILAKVREVLGAPNGAPAGSPAGTPSGALPERLPAE